MLSWIIKQKKNLQIIFAHVLEVPISLKLEFLETPQVHIASKHDNLAKISNLQPAKLLTNCWANYAVAVLRCAYQKFSYLLELLVKYTYYYRNKAGTVRPWDC